MIPPQTRVGRAFRQMVLAHIAAEVPGLHGRVFDKAPAGGAFPYATLGASDWTPQGSDCISARLQSLQIDIWHSASNKGVLEDLTDDVAAALEGFADQAQLTMHEIAVTLARVLDDPSGDLHGVVQIEALLEG